MKTFAKSKQTTKVKFRCPIDLYLEYEELARDAGTTVDAEIVEVLDEHMARIYEEANKPERLTEQPDCVIQKN